MLYNYHFLNYTDLMIRGLSNIYETKGSNYIATEVKKINIISLLE